MNMWKKLFMLLLLIGISAAGTSCASYKARQANIKNMSKIRIGMTKDQVRAIMGDPLDEKFCTDNVWFYQTRVQWHDGLTTRDECTPFIFDQDEQTLVGFGDDFFNENRKKYNLSNWTQKSINATAERF